MSTDGKNRPNIRRTGRIGGPNPGAAQLDYWHRQEHEAILKQALAAIPQFQGVRSIQVGSTQLTGNVKLATSDTVNVVHADDAVRFQAFATTQTENITGGGGNPAQSIVPVTYVVAAANSKNPLRADYRCSGTGDQTTIQNAINALPSEGGSIGFLEGTYHFAGTVTVPNNVTLIALGTGAIIRREFTNAAFFDASGGTGLFTVGDFGTTARTNIEFRGLTFDGNAGTYPSGGNYGILLHQACSHIRVIECTFTNLAAAAVIAYNDGLDASHAITDCDFIGNVHEPTPPTSANAADQPGQTTFYIYGNVSTTLGTLNRNLRFIDNRAAFISVWRAAHCLFEGNVCSWGIRTENSNGHVFANNLFNIPGDGNGDMTTVGLDLQYFEDLLIIGNAFLGTHVTDAFTSASTTEQPYGTATYCYGIQAINSRAGGPLRIIGNSFEGLGTGIAFSAGIDFVIDNNSFSYIQNYPVYLQPSILSVAGGGKVCGNYFADYNTDPADQGTSDGIYMNGGGANTPTLIADNTFINQSGNPATGVSIHLVNTRLVTLSRNTWSGPGTGITDGGTGTVWIMQHDGTNLRTTNEGIRFKGYGESSGYVWTSDANGVGSWTDVSGLGLIPKRGVLLELITGYTPQATGLDDAVLLVPYDPDDGTTVVTWNVKRIDLRVDQAGGTPTVQIEKFTGTGAWSGTVVGSVALGSGAYEGAQAAGFSVSTLTSGDKIRCNITDIGPALDWTVVVTLEAT